MWSWNGMFAWCSLLKSIESSYSVFTSKDMNVWSGVLSHDTGEYLKLFVVVNKSLFYFASCFNFWCSNPTVNKIYFLVKSGIKMSNKLSNRITLTAIMAQTIIRILLEQYFSSWDSTKSSWVARLNDEEVRLNFHIAEFFVKWLTYFGSSGEQWMVLHELH